MDLIRRITLKLLSTRAGTRFFRATTPKIDRLVLKLTGGKATMSGLILPTMKLTSMGRKSGLPREQPLVYLEDERGFVVVGTNWGQSHHPAWTHNLVANPDATVTVDGNDVPVRANLLEGQERERVWNSFSSRYPNYRNYPTWAGERKIRIFRLEPR